MSLLNITTATEEVQAAVMAVLKGDAGHSALVSGIFDTVPEGTSYPMKPLAAVARTGNTPLMLACASPRFN